MLHRTARQLRASRTSAVWLDVVNPWPANRCQQFISDVEVPVDPLSLIRDSKVPGLHLTRDLNQMAEPYIVVIFIVHLVCTTGFKLEI